MAGHRGSQPRRSTARIAEHQRRVTTAPTGPRQVAAAFDRWRSAVKRHPDAQRLIHEQATRLNREAIGLEGAA